MNVRRRSILSKNMGVLFNFFVIFMLLNSLFTPFHGQAEAQHEICDTVEGASERSVGREPSNVSHVASYEVDDKVYYGGSEQFLDNERVSYASTNGTYASIRPIKDLGMAKVFSNLPSVLRYSIENISIMGAYIENETVWNISNEGKVRYYPKRQQSQESKGSNEANRYILIVNRSNIEFAESAIRSIGFKILWKYRNVISGFCVIGPADKIGLLQDEGYVKAAYPDRYVHASLIDSVPLINATLLWGALNISVENMSGCDVRVAIIDTGVDYTHPDLGGNENHSGLFPNWKVIAGYDFVNNDTDPMDDNGHGTHVACIIAGTGNASSHKVCGVAPNALIMAYKVLDKDGRGYVSDIIAAIDSAVDPDNNESTDDGADVINLSLGGWGCNDDPLCEAVKGATERGVIVVAAAGNLGAYGNFTVGSPALSPYCIAVGATTHLNGSHDSGGPDKVSWFSSIGPSYDYTIKPDVVAPGGDVEVLHENNTTKYSMEYGVMAARAKNTSLGYIINDYYTRLSGTSMAAPHVAGLAALLLQKYKYATPHEIKARICCCAKDINYSAYVQGGGRIDCYGAYKTPIITNVTQLSFGSIRETPTKVVRVIQVKNIDDAHVNLSIRVDVKDYGNYSIYTDKKRMSLSPSQSESIAVTLELHGKCNGIYTGYVVMTWENSIGSGTYRVPYQFIMTKRPDLYINNSALVLEPAVLGKDMGINLTIVNIGGGNATNTTLFAIIYRHYPQTGLVLMYDYITKKIGTVHAGERKKIALHYNIKDIHLCALGIILTADDDLNWGSNYLLRFFHVRSPDIVVESVSAPQNCMSGQNIPIIVCVKNAGDWNASNIYLRVYYKAIPEGSEGVIWEDYITLQSGCEKNITLTWSQPHYGLYRIIAVADADNSIWEEDEKNNAGDKEIVVMCDGVDLMPLRLVTSPPIPVEKMAAKVETIMYNLGNADTNASVALFENGVYVNGSMFFLPHGSKITIYINYTPSKRGPSDILVSADPYNNVSEVNESNNNVSTCMYISGYDEWPMPMHDTMNSGYSPYSPMKTKGRGVKLMEKYVGSKYMPVGVALSDINNDCYNEIIMSFGGLVHQTYGGVMCISHNGTEIWEFHTRTTSFGAWVTPRFVDWDADGDLDMIVGGLFGSIHGYHGYMYVYINNGTNANPSYNYSFRLEDVNGSAIDVGYRSVPWIVDWDNDRRFDLVVGSYYYDGETEHSYVYLFRNVGTLSSPQFNSGEKIYAGNEPIDPGTCSFPTVIDWDGDGKKDLLLGVTVWNDSDSRYHGYIYFYKNIGLDAKPRFSNYEILKCNDSAIDVEGAEPSIYPIDWDGDGDLDIVVGNGAGYLDIFLRNENTTNLVKGGRVIGHGGPYDNSGLLKTFSKSAPNIFDFDDDGQSDIIVGDMRGKVYVYTNNGNTFDFKTWLEGTEDSPVYSCPVVADINMDGKQEIIFSSYNGKVYCLGPDGKKLWDYVIINTFFNTPMVADVSKNSKGLEVIAGNGFDFPTGSPFESVTTLYTISSDGKLLWKKDFTRYPYASIGLSVSIADLNHDGNMEIIVPVEGDGVYCLDSYGNIVWYTRMSGAIYAGIYDLDMDGNYEVLVLDYWSLHCLDHYGKELWRVNNATTLFAIAPSSSSNHVVLGGNMGAFVINSTGRVYSILGQQRVYGYPIVGNLDNDYLAEALFSTKDAVFAYEINGTMLWNYSFYHSLVCAVGDINTDESPDIVCINDTSLLVLTVPYFCVFADKYTLQFGRGEEHTVNITIENNRNVSDEYRVWAEYRKDYWNVSFDDYIIVDGGGYEKITVRIKSVEDIRDGIRDTLHLYVQSQVDGSVYPLDIQLESVLYNPKIDINSTWKLSPGNRSINFIVKNDGKSDDDFEVNVYSDLEVYPRHMNVHLRENSEEKITLWVNISTSVQAWSVENISIRIESCGNRSKVVASVTQIIVLPTEKIKLYIPHRHVLLVPCVKTDIPIIIDNLGNTEVFVEVSYIINGTCSGNITLSDSELLLKLGAEVVVWVTVNSTSNISCTLTVFANYSNKSVYGSIYLTSSIISADKLMYKCVYGKISSIPIYVINPYDYALDVNLSITCSWHAEPKNVSFRVYPEHMHTLIINISPGDEIYANLSVHIETHNYSDTLKILLKKIVYSLIIEPKYAKIIVPEGKNESLIFDVVNNGTDSLFCKISVLNLSKPWYAHFMKSIGLDPGEKREYKITFCFDKECKECPPINCTVKFDSNMIVKTAHVELIPQIPDFVVNKTSIYSQDIILCNRKNILTIKIYNNGWYGKCLVKVYDKAEDLYICCRKVGVGARSHCKLKVPWVPQIEGNHTLRLFVYPEGCEMNMKNNEVYTNFSVRIPVIDVSVMGLVFSNNQPIENESVYMSVIVKGEGNDRRLVKVNIICNNETKYTTVARLVCPCIRIIPLNMRFYPGSYRIIANITPLDNENNTKNNEIMREIFVSRAAQQHWYVNASIENVAYNDINGDYVKDILWFKGNVFEICNGLTGGIIVHDELSVERKIVSACSYGRGFVLAVKNRSSWELWYVNKSACKILRRGAGNVSYADSADVNGDGNLEIVLALANLGNGTSVIRVINSNYETIWESAQILGTPSVLRCYKNITIVGTHKGMVRIFYRIGTPYQSTGYLSFSNPLYNARKLTETEFLLFTGTKYVYTFDITDTHMPIMRYSIKSWKTHFDAVYDFFSADVDKDGIVEQIYMANNSIIMLKKWLIIYKLKPKWHKDYSVIPTSLIYSDTHALLLFATNKAILCYKITKHVEAYTDLAILHVAFPAIVPPSTEVNISAVITNLGTSEPSRWYIGLTVENKTIMKEIYGLERNRMINITWTWNTSDNSGIYNINILIPWKSPPLNDKNVTNNVFTGEIIVDKKPSVRAYASPNVTLTYSTVFFNATANDEDGNINVTYWIINGEVLMGNNVTYIFTDDGVYNVTFVAMDNLGVSSGANVSVTVHNRPPIPKIHVSNTTSPVGVPLIFDAANTTDIDGVVKKYVWDFGDGSMAEGIIVEHAYTEQGKYTVRLIVTDDDGAVGEVRVTINVSGIKPVPIISASESSTLTYTPITFDASQSYDQDGYIVEYLWDFGDGETAKGKKAIHTYRKGGVYVVTLTVIDNDNYSSNATITVSITNRKPMIEITGDYAVRSGEQLSLYVRVYDADGYIEKVIVDFGDGFVDNYKPKGNTITVEHVYAMPGRYLIVITAIDDNGAENKTYWAVSVLNRPPIVESVVYNNTVYTKSVAAYHISCVDDDGYIKSVEWDMGDGILLYGTTVYHAYSDDGNYCIRIRITDNLNATAEKQVWVHVLNRKPIAIIGNYTREGYSGEYFRFHSSSIDLDGKIAIQIWDFGDGSMYYGAYVEHKYKVHGVYTVTLSVMDDDGSWNSTSVIVIVKNSPPEIVAKTPENTNLSVCVGSTLSFMVYVSDYDNDPISYYWHVNGANTSEISNKLIYKFNKVGDYIISLCIKDGSYTLVCNWYVKVYNETKIKETKKIEIYEYEHEENVPTYDAFLIIILLAVLLSAYIGRGWLL